MSRPRRMILALVGPALAYPLLLRLVDQAGGATVMLGAVAGTPYAAILGMALLLLLRLYLVLVVPALLAGWLAHTLVGRLGRAKQESSCRPPATPPSTSRS